MKKHLIITCALCLTATIANSQAGNRTVITWLQPAPDAVTAASYLYKYHLSQNDPGTVFPTKVECGGLKSPYTCNVLMPIMIQGPFTMQISAGNSLGVSDKSLPFAGVYQTQKPYAPLEPRYTDPIQVPLPPTGARVPNSEPGSPKPAENPYQGNKAGKASAPAKGKK
jgi:hypothetical protein